MALMAARGELPRPDCAIFADTQFEPKAVYAHLDWLEAQLPFPVYRVTEGSICDDHLAGRNSTGQRFSSMPLYSANGMGRRQCTREYKIHPIRRKIRELIGLKQGQHAPKSVVVNQWIGISTDEAARMKPSQDVWIENTWPLIDAGMARHDCSRWFEKRYPGRALTKSACIACPFHNDGLWREMKQADPESFQQAVDFDARIRGSGKSGQQQFVHRSCQPLDQVDFRNLEDRGQLNFFNNECEGMCGV
jgi:hypothetical protein